VIPREEHVIVSAAPVESSMDAAQAVPGCPSVAAPTARSRQRAAPL